MFLTYSKAVLIPLILSLLFLSNLELISASTHTAPNLFVNHASCYRSIYQSDDLYCLVRYSLPVKITDIPVSPEAWCAELVNTNGCIATPVDPIEPTSLEQNTVFISLYDNCVADDCSSADLAFFGRLPRIGFSIGGIYLSAGHTITWADIDIGLCVEASPTAFGTTTQDCQIVLWNNDANTQLAQRNLLGADLTTQLIAVEVEQAQPANTYIERGLINSNGSVLALEALPGANLILDVFASTSLTLVIDATPTPGPLPVQTQIDTSTATVALALSEAGGVFGISGEAFGTLVSIIFILVMFILLYMITDIVFAAIGSTSLGTVLVLLGFLQFEVMAVFVSILALPAAVKIVRYMIGQNA